LCILKQRWIEQYRTRLSKEEHDFLLSLYGSTPLADNIVIPSFSHVLSHLCETGKGLPK
jgi:hypothetical protein